MSDEVDDDPPVRMRLKDSPSVCGPVVGRGKNYITIENETTETVTRVSSAFELAPPEPPREDALKRLELTHEVVLNLLDEIVAGRFDGRDRLLKGQAKLIAEGMRENIASAGKPKVAE